MNAVMLPFSAKPEETERSVAFVTFPGVKLLDVTGPLQVFQDANTFLGRSAYATPIASHHGGPVETDTGVLLNTRRLAGIGLDEGDTLMIAGGDGVFAATRDTRFVHAVQKSAEKAGRIAATCTGAFLLGSAGLLKGKRAVTHWRHCDQLAEDCPDTDVDPDPIFIEDGHIWTSAGVTAGIDLALALVERDHGRDLALELARSLLVYVKRPGGQSQFSEALKQQKRSVTGRFDALHFWMKDNLQADLKVEALAERSGMSARNFARLYTDDTGLTPARAVEQFRVDAARAMLENPNVSIKTVASQTGFGNDERMRRSFARLIGVTPQAYRERFAVEGS